MNDQDYPIPEGTALCSSISQVNNEQLFATASHAKFWFMLECRQIYGAKALEESSLPPQVKTYLASALKTIPDSRVQLIKQDKPADGKRVSFFVGVTIEGNSRLYEFQLSHYTELMDLDLEQILISLDDYTKFLRSEPVYLVCTNGKRDPCCLKFGFSFYKSLSNIAPEPTWQTSHVGGHRFAANLVCFPDGLFYGRLSESDVQKIIETSRSGELMLEKYRGRSCYPAPVQAAEFFLRRQTGEKSIHAYLLKGVIPSGENRWEVLFLEPYTNRRHKIQVSSAPSEFGVLQSCRDLQRSNGLQFYLEANQA